MWRGGRRHALIGHKEEEERGVRRRRCGIADADWAGGRADWIGGGGGPPLSAAARGVDGEWCPSTWSRTYPPSSRNG